MRRVKGKLCLVGLSAIAALGAFAVPAAASPHPFMATVNSSLANGCGIAISSAGTLHVSDYTAPNVPCAVAYDSNERLFSNYFHGMVVASGSGGGVIDPNRSTGVAVDPSTDALYVTHRTHVSAYEPPAEAGDVPTSIGASVLVDAYGAAVSGFPDTLGHLYVADAADDTVAVFDPATDTDNPIATIDGSETPLGEFRDLTDTALAVDATNGHIFVLDNLQPGYAEPIAAVYEFDSAGTYVGQTVHWSELKVGPPVERIHHALIHGGPSGLAVDNSLDPETGQIRGTLYVTSGNEVKVVGTTPDGKPIEEGSKLYSFCPSQPTQGQLEDGLCPPLPYPETHVLGASRAGSGQGTVTSLLSGEKGSPFTGIECGTICASEYDQGTQVTLIATPRPHSAFSGWSVSGQPSACPGTGSCKVTLGADTEVIASFTAIPQQTLTVAKAGNGQGTVTSSPAGIECGAFCQAGFNQSSLVTLTAEADAGSEFLGWSGAGCSGTGSCKVSMASAQNVAASFKAITRITPVDKSKGARILAVSVTGEGAGTITADPGGIECGTPCSAAYAPGTKVTLSAKPDGESAFSGWSGCDSSTATICTVTMGSSRTVNAAFAEATPLELAGLELKGAKALLSVAVPGKGTVSARAKQLQPVSAQARKATTLTLALVLNKAPRKALAEKGKLAVKVTLTFKPAGAGVPRTLEKTIVFRKGGKK